MLLLIADILLALGATLRLTRFIVADDVPGGWYIKQPLLNRAWADSTPDQRRTYTQDGDPANLTGWRGKVLAGLGCPYCMSVWMAGFTTLTLLLAGGPGEAADWWRYIAGFLTLAWLTGHIASRVGDTED